MMIPRIAHTFVFVLVLSLAATGLWAAAAEEEPAAAMEKEMVLDPSTGEMVEAPRTAGPSPMAGPTMASIRMPGSSAAGRATHVSEVVEKLVIGTIGR